MDNIQAYILIFLIWLASIILLRSIFSKCQRKYRLPPSPLALPLIGHLHLFRPPPYKALLKLADRHGPIIQIYLGSNPCVVVSSAEIAKEIFKIHDISFSNRATNTAISYLTYDNSDMVFAPYGNYWKYMKKLCMTELLSGKMLDQLCPIRQEEISHFLQIVHKKAEIGAATNVGSELLKLTSSIITRMAIGKSWFSTEDEAREVTERVKESSKLCGRFNLQDYYWLLKLLDLQGFGKKLKEVRDGFDRMIEKIIEEHEAERKRSNGNDEPKDILDVFLSILDDESSEVKLTKVNIKAFLADVLSGDTTSASLEWALAELINHPSIMEKARKEIDSVIGKDRIVVESDIANLPYLQAIIKETLRLHPPFPIIPRETIEDCTISGYDIPAKTQVSINVWALGRDPDYWPNPHEFKPERFLGVQENGRNNSQFDVRGQHYQLLPFGSGRRGCPGLSLALNVAESTLAAMIQCFEWKVVGGRESVDMQEGEAIILQRAQPLMCIPVPRITPLPFLLDAHN